MNPILKNILAVLGGLIIGSFVNMFFVNIGPMVFSPPEGADVTSFEGLKATIHLFEAKHFIFPFLAHAIGTLVGAFIAARFGATRKFTLAMIVGSLFFVGGLMNVIMLNGPMWFNVLDLVGAYFPMAYLGAKLAVKA